MVFEEFLLESLKPRVVLLNVLKTQVFSWTHSTIWEWRVANRASLQAEGPAAAAAVLHEVNPMARSVANQFRERLGLPDDPPPITPTPAGNELRLPLSSNDLFWLPDEIQNVSIARLVPPIVGATNDDHIAVIMLGLESFEFCLRLAMDHPNLDQPDEFRPGTFLRDALLTIFDCFPTASRLIVTVDVPRHHISSDQLQEVRVTDAALLRMEGDGPRRCYSAHNAYEMLQEYLMKDDDEGFFFRQGWAGRVLPELSFAFLRPA